MRGSPLFRALAAFIIIGILGWPLARLTHRSNAEPTAPFAAAVEEQSVAVAFSFTHLPRRIAVWHLGQERWSADVKEPEIDTELKLSWPPEGIDLRIVVDWPEGTPLAAAQVRVTDPEGVEHTGSIFSKGPADEILTFH